MFEFIVSFFPRAVAQGIPLLYGSTGEIITQKSGNMNLGIEYELTTVAYGTPQANGTVADTHNVSNNRLLLSVMYAF